MGRHQNANWCPYFSKQLGSIIQAFYSTIEMKAYIHTENIINIIIALFVMPKIRKQTKCPSVGEWTDKPV